MIRNNRLWQFTVILLFTPALFANDQAYSYSLVAQTQQLFNGHLLTGAMAGQLAIDNHGKVSFLAQFNDDPLSTSPAAWPWGIFSQDGLIVRTGSTIGNLTLTAIRELSVTPNGELCFAGDYAENGGGSALFTPDRVLAKTGDNIGEYQLASIFGLSRGKNATDAGQVVFLATTTNERTVRVFTLDRMIAQPGQYIGWQNFGTGIFAIDGSPVITGNGQVAFSAQLDGGGSAIFTQDRLLVRSGQGTGEISPTINSYSRPTMNSQGTVVFFGEYPSGEGIFTQQDVVAHTGTSIDGRTLDGFKWQGTSSLNDANTVAFPAHYRDSWGTGGSGIYVRDGSDLNTVAHGGQLVNGLQLSSTYASPVINNAGQVGFAYTLTPYGSVGIFVATPISAQ